MAGNVEARSAADLADDYIIKTYRYLRLGMAFLLVLLAAAVLLEWRATSYDCLQTSVSAYYYTPAQAVFVSALVVVGACMIILRARNDWEDLALNIGGLLAPVVAFVPTPGAGECHSVLVVGRDQTPFVQNNMSAYFVTGVLAVIVTVVLVLKKNQATTLAGPTATKIGLIIILLIVVVIFAALATDAEWFLGNAHYIAANSLFVCIMVVVAINARLYRRGEGVRGRSFTGGQNLYAVVLVAMVLVLAIMLPIKVFGHWDHAVFWIELCLLVLFAAFWLLQTFELWRTPVKPASLEGPTVDDTARGV